ncbi:ensconsin isoform X2 [Calliphora vicina]|uniref:ensconsin isoform X2 n=1 Tax=Calliphora vicina TaxID=7373 RepID=UPI00325AAB31
MASLGGEQQISTDNSAAEITNRAESREGSVERKAAKERDDKLKVARERQNEERQRKIEELKAQAEAAQRYREQKEEERRRRIDEIRQRDSDKRTQVEERKKAIMEAEKERREYILRKNQERESRIEVKKRERNSIGYAFGSSTPRLLEPSDFGMVSPSTFWGQRRSTSISNVAGASLSRRSSERELNDSGSKKRATSASGTERHDDHRRKSSSMYEVFNWGYTNDEPPKRFSLSIVGSEINIDGPPQPPPTTTASKFNNTKNTFNNTENNYNNNHHNYHHKQYSNHNFYNTKEDNVDTSHIVFRSVARRKTDLMPTIPSPRDGHYGSRSSLSNTPSRTPGRAFSMNRLDQLAQPIRRNGEHIRAIMERQRREQMEMMDETESLGGGRRSAKKTSAAGSNNSKMSRSMIHLAGDGAPRPKYNLGGGISTSFLPLGSGSRNACKSMTHLGHYYNNNSAWSNTTTTPRSNLGLQTAATKKYLQSSLASSASNTFKRGQISNTNLYRFDTDSLLLMNSPSILLNPGSRSGTVTPGGHLNNSRPGSAMSTSTTMSTSGFINRRSVPAARKPRPASIAGTGVSLEEINKLKKENKPPVKTTSSLSPSTSAQTTPKRSTNMMSTSLIVTSSSSRLFSAEKKTPIKRDPLTPKATTPKPLSKTASSDRLNKLSKEKSKDIMAKSAITPPVANRTTAKEPTKSKEEKEAINQVKTEVVTKPAAQQNGQKELNDTFTVQQPAAAVTSQHEEKTDEGTEKAVTEPEPAPAVVAPPKPKSRNGSKEGSIVRELAPATQDNNDAMTASMIAKSKITTEEEAKAALAERRRLAREEAERQAELERQRVEAERLAELKRQEEEAERQRQFEEEAMRMAQEQRKAEEERLRQAIEEATQREEEEKRKREDEEKQRLEREEAEKKAKEEAEKQKIEVAERLKREEKEREERRKRVEAIMSRTRRGGANTTPNSTPTKENNNSPKPAEATPVTPTVAAVAVANTAEAPAQGVATNSNNDINATNTAATVNNITNDTTNSTNEVVVVNSSNTESVSTSGSTSSTATTPPTPASQQPEQTHTQPQQEQPQQQQQAQPTTIIPEPQNTQAMYEQSVIDKENSLINSFSNMIIDENVKNIQQNIHQQQQLQAQIVVEETNGKKFVELQNNDSNITTTTPTSVANGNGHHIESINNKNDIDLLQTVVPSTNQLIDLSLDSQDNNVNFNNNNSLLTTTNTLVTADSHENKDISLL